jgi:dTDP-4-dehydrorhamnose 3,5-epimerase
MKVIKKSIPDVLVITPKKFEDNRGYFYESFNHKIFESSVGRKVNFVQDNHSKSYKNVLRGLHYQVKNVQGKLIRVTLGKIFDVAVDLRSHSQTFGMWTSHILSEENNDQIWIPEGFAHGFLVLSDEAEVLYKATDYYMPNAERCIKWDDPIINIKWPNHSQLLISNKDHLGENLKNAEIFS